MKRLSRRPVPAVIMVLTFIVFYFLSTRTVFGRSVYSVGGNEEAARLSGIPIGRTRILILPDHEYLVIPDGPGREIHIAPTKDLFNALISPSGSDDWVDLSTLIGVDQFKGGEEYMIKVAKGKYDLYGEDIDDVPHQVSNVEPHGYYVWDPGGGLSSPGEVHLTDPATKSVVRKVLDVIIPNPFDPEVLGWFHYAAHWIAPQYIDNPRNVRLNLKTLKGKQVIGFGDELIDPDGYVYDAALGLEHVIPGSTVTCDEYDEDLQSRSRWPAELYENQINPQVVGDDAYYAFFVPAGLYRVRAEAEHYMLHTSPDIRVIDVIVHYNVPMEQPKSYMPVLMK